LPGEQTSSQSKSLIAAHSIEVRTAGPTCQLDDAVNADVAIANIEAPPAQYLIKNAEILEMDVQA
jgi:hypothetical protein